MIKARTATRSEMHSIVGPMRSRSSSVPRHRRKAPPWYHPRKSSGRGAGGGRDGGWQPTTAGRGRRDANRFRIEPRLARQQAQKGVIGGIDRIRRNGAACSASYAIRFGLTAPRRMSLDSNSMTMKPNSYRRFLDVFRILRFKLRHHRPSCTRGGFHI